jgi:hypothetical protein
MTWTVDDMHALGSKHAGLEARGDLEATMATLVPDPVYELWPIGLRMQGESQVRAYYEHLLGRFVPMTVGYKLLDEWVNENSVSQEYDIEVAVDGAPEKHRVIGILFREGRLLGGERVFASERCLRLMAGDALIDRLKSI